MDRHVARLKWIAGFDMEDLVGAILQRGTWFSIGLLLASAILRRSPAYRHAGVEAPLQGINVLDLVLDDLPRVADSVFWSSGLAHLGVIVLMLIPYVRVLASVFYFACVERSGRHVVLTGVVAAVLTYIVFLG